MSRVPEKGQTLIPNANLVGGPACGLRTQQPGVSLLHLPPPLTHQARQSELQEQLCSHKFFPRA